PGFFGDEWQRVAGQVVGLAGKLDGAQVRDLRHWQFAGFRSRADHTGVERRVMGDKYVGSDEFKQVRKLLAHSWRITDHVGGDVVDRDVARVEVVETGWRLHEPLLGFHDLSRAYLDQAHRAGGADKTVCSLKIYCCEVQCHAQ